MYYSSYTKFIKAYYYNWNLLFQMNPQSFQCIKYYRSYANLNRAVCKRYIVPKPPACEEMWSGTLYRSRHWRVKITVIKNTIPYSATKPLDIIPLQNILGNNVNMITSIKLIESMECMYKKCPLPSCISRYHMSRFVVSIET